MVARPLHKTDIDEDAHSIFKREIIDLGLQTDIQDSANSGEHEDADQALMGESDNFEGLAPADLAQNNREIRPGSLVEIKYENKPYRQEFC